MLILDLSEIENGGSDVLKNVWGKLENDNIYDKCLAITGADLQNFNTVCILSSVPLIWTIHEVAKVIHIIEKLVPFLTCTSTKIMLQTLSLASACDRQITRTS